MYTVITDFERPDPALVERANTSHVGVTGVHAGPRQVMHPDIKPLLREWRVCGPAFTVRPEWTDDLLMGEVAAKYARPGDVLVIDAGGRLDCAAWGAGMTSAAIYAGCNGVVVDGASMNTNLLIERYKLPVFARGQVARGHSAEKPGWLNVPVICGGVIVYPGDIVLGDADGVVVLPRERAAEILDTSLAYARRRPADEPAPQPARPFVYYEDRRSDEKLRAIPGVTYIERPTTASESAP